MRKGEKQGKGAVLKFSEHKRKREDDLQDEVDVLFRLPLAEFTDGRNALAARLKKSGRGDDAARVKALVKPPISAWAVNQLYWNHREAFDQLIATGERFHKAQKSGKVADMRDALDTRRETLSELSDLATSLLADAEHNSSLDTIRRITTTLEAMSAMSDWASRSDGPSPGRLTHDVDPPGFESFGSFAPAATKQGAGGRRQTVGTPRSETAKSTRSTGSSKSDSGAASAAQKRDKVQLEETRKAKIAAAKVSLQEAKRSLTATQARAQNLEAAQKKAEAEVKKAEKHNRDAEEESRRAKAATENATERARSIAVEVEEAATAVDAAELTVAKASKELESLVRESSGR